MTRNQDERTPEQERSDIDAGRRGDKTPGFDPAAAPMETDAEAANTHTDPSTVHGSEPSRFRNAATFANAMRPMDGVPKPGSNSALLVIAAIALLAIVAIVVTAMLLR